jgi:hypothetical protein
MELPYTLPGPYHIFQVVLLQVQLHIIMAPTQCCPTCPRKLASSSGLYRHREACNEYQNYMAARRTLRQRVTDTQLRFKKPRTSISPGPQQELEATQADDIVSTFFIMGPITNLVIIICVVFLSGWLHWMQCHVSAGGLSS